MYLDTINDHDNNLDMGSVVLAALHRWKRQEPRRRQRLWRQSLKRRQEQRRDRQTGTGDSEVALVMKGTAAPPGYPDRSPAGEDCTVGQRQGGGGPAAPTLGYEPPQPSETGMNGDSRLVANEPADGAVRVVCPRLGCHTLCCASQPGPRTESPSPAGVPAEFLATDGGGDGGLEVFRCPGCGWCVAVRVGAVWMPLEALLRDTQHRGTGWHRVTSLADRVALYLLVVYIYGERERSAARREPELRPPPPGDSALLLFAEDGAAVGFATLKRRGQLLGERAGPERFQMDILDTVFVRRSARRRGRAGALLERLAGGAAHLERPLGITRPTPVMRQLLHAFLAGRPWARGVLFEVTWAAGVNNRTNIWDQMVADGGVSGGEEGSQRDFSPPTCA